MTASNNLPKYSWNLRNKMEAAGRFKVQERERKIKLIRKKAWGKRKCTQKKKLLDILYENDWHILTLFLKILSHQKIYKFCSGIMFSMMTKHHQSLLKITLRCLWLYDLHILFVSQFNESTNWEGTTYS